MKRFFKTLLVALVLVPALCLVTACGGGNNGGSTGGGGNGGGGNGGGGTVVEETLQQKYDAFYTALGKLAQKGSYTASATQYMGSTQTVTTQHLEEDEWVDDEEQADPQTQTAMSGKTVQTVNAETGEMVINYYYWVEEEEPAVIGRGVGDEEQADEEEEFVPHWELAVGEGEYIVKTDDEEPAYIYIDGNNAEYVSPDHAAHAYALANSDYVSTLKGLIFSSNLEEEVAELGAIPQYLMMEMAAELGSVDVACTPTANITKDGDVYSLSIVLNFVATEKVVEEEEGNQQEVLISPEDDLEVGAEEDAEPAVLMQGSITLAITYTADDITAFSLVVSLVNTEVEEEEETKTITAQEMRIEMTAEVTYEYTASEMPEDLDLEELEPEAARVYPEFYLDGERVNGCSVEFNQDVTDVITGRFEEVEDDFELENAHIDGWYYDAACTQKVGETDTFNYKSWETPVLYAKIAADEGYALVIEKTGFVIPAAMVGVMKVAASITGEALLSNIDAEGFYVVMEPYYDVYAVEEGSIDYDDYLENENVVKITVNGVEYTESISELEDGKTYEVKVYYDMNAMMNGGATK